jgi:hypothetical protein
MPQKTYPSEKSAYIDPLTGISVTRLTNSQTNHNVHIYFTENAFTKGGEEIFFLSDRDTEGFENVFSVNSRTGLMTRHTAYTDKAVSALSKDPQSRYLLYNLKNTSVIQDVKTGVSQKIADAPEGFKAGRVSLNCDGSMIGVLYNEDVNVEHGLNYSGFEEKMYRVKRCLIYLFPFENGKVGTGRVAVRDTFEGGHLQFSPVNPHLFMYCHEGPWHLVLQRIYLVNTQTLDIMPCFRQNKQDSVGHEFWTQNGLVFFDNRGPGHDGTITVHRTQAVASEMAESDFIPYAGLADETGKVLRTYPLPHYCNHYHGNSRNTLLVGDEVDDLVTIDLTCEPPMLKKLCHHGTSWNGQFTHCHPTISWDDTQLLFASDREGAVNLYLIEL